MLSPLALSKFLDFSEILDTDLMWNVKDKNAKREGLGRCFPFCSLLSFFEPEGDPTANRTTAGAELGEYLSVFAVWLDVQQIARIKDSLGAHGQTEARQLLC